VGSSRKKRPIKRWGGESGKIKGDNIVPETRWVGPRVRRHRAHPREKAKTGRHQRGSGGEESLPLSRRRNGGRRLIVIIISVRRRGSSQPGDCSKRENIKGLELVGNAEGGGGGEFWK